MNYIPSAAATFLLLAVSAPAQWSPGAPTHSPAGRYGMGLAYNPFADSVLMFGGSTNMFPTPNSNETWSYDGTDWTLLTPANAPIGRVAIELVFDSTRGRFVMYGGWTTAISVGMGNDETWEFDGTDWAQVTTASTPGGRWKYGACFDAARGRYVMYGGSLSGLIGATNTTFEYDGASWQQVATTGNPGPLERPAMCYHTALGRTVLFGGINPAVGGVDTTWLYDGTAWTAATVVGSKPAPRTGAKMVYDDAHGVCVLTGGMDAVTGAPFSDTWEFDGGSWTQIASPTSGGRDLGLAFVPSRQQVVRFGGVVGSTVNAETWVYGATLRYIGTGCAGSSGVPVLAATDAPRLGQNFGLILANLNPAMPIAVMAVGLSAIAPVPLDGIGMTGCTAYVSPDVLLSVPASGGSATVNWPMPASASLIGTELFAQGISVDPNVNPAWLVASNALAGTLGH